MSAKDRTFSRGILVIIFAAISAPAIAQVELFDAEQHVGITDSRRIFAVTGNVIVGQIEREYPDQAQQLFGPRPGGVSPFIQGGQAGSGLAGEINHATLVSSVWLANHPAGAAPL